MKSVGEHQPLGWTEFEDILTELCEENEDRLSRILTRAWSYLSNVVSRDEESELRSKLKALPKRLEPLEKTMVTLQQHWLEQGKDAGIKEVLNRMLPLIYPRYSGNESQLAKLWSDDLNKLLEAVTIRAEWKAVAGLLKPKSAQKKNGKPLE